MAGFYIDLGVLSNESSTRYLLGIECDGATYHSSRSARDRDRIRQQILESRGWRIHRIWSTDWFNRRGAEEHRLLDALERAESGRHTKPLTGASQTQIWPDPMPESVPPKTPRVSVPYTEANFKVNSPQAPHEAPIEKVQEAVRRIVDVEGPIHEDEIARRLATVWGLDRAGSRIQEVTRRALSALERARSLRCDGAFWNQSQARTVHVRDRSEAQSTTLRKAEYLPPAEVSVAAAEIVRESVRVSVDELVVEISRRLGFLRTGADLHEVIRKVIQSELGKALKRQEDDSIMLMSPG
jgi:hypothetical protein